jgi:hypothetical protein
MTDTEFAVRLLELEKKGDVPAMREFLKQNGGMKRLVALAVRGAIRAESAVKKKGTFIPDDFPDQKAIANARAYWLKERRPDVVANMERHCDEFREHYREEQCVSWEGRWRTWYINALRFNRPPIAGTPGAPVLFEQTDFNGWARRLDLFKADGTWSTKWGPKPNEPGTRVPVEILKKRGFAQAI